MKDFVCKHERVVMISTGSRWFSWGDVTDDIEDKLFCWDCGKEMTDMPSCPGPLSLEEWESIFVEEGQQA